MKKFFIQIAALLITAIIAMAYATNHLPQIPGFISTSKQSKVLVIDDVKLNIEIADTADKRKVGLSGRESLATDSGMLFIFDKPSIYNFWMKDTKIPLDMIWIKENKVVDITKNASPQVVGQADSDLTIYSPKETVTTVLEVNSGFTDVNGIKIGDSIQIK